MRLQLSLILKMISYSTAEMRKVNSWFPNLFYSQKSIKGEIEFSVKYELSGKKNKKWIIVDSTSGCHSIRDAYEIEIRLDEFSLGNPKVFETGGRIKNLAEKLDMRIIDLHLNPNDGDCCLGLFFPNPSETLSEFVLNKVYPYFVWQGYFEKYNLVPPCGEYSHGSQGLQEFKRHIFSVGRNQPCPCGSGNKFKTCCIEEIQNLLRRK